ncbi:MAG: hypothetical protein HUK40_21790 [Desulfobacter sp.]|nr:hypothetical protein [Desulfobacter sp.]
MADSKPGFDLNTFDTHWASLDSNARTDLIARAHLFMPMLGILPILEGLFSYHFNDRTFAKKSLEALRSDIRKKLNAPLDAQAYKQARSDALRICAKIYLKLSGDLAFADKSLLLSTLVSFGDSGLFLPLKPFTRIGFLWM